MAGEEEVEGGVMWDGLVWEVSSARRPAVLPSREALHGADHHRRHSQPPGCGCLDVEAAIQPWRVPSLPHHPQVFRDIGRG